MSAALNLLPAVGALLLAMLVPSARAQGYPKVPAAAQAEADGRRAAADRRSDEAFARARPEIRARAAKGKPYIPDADEPADLPPAKIPAFPGAWGGGMYSFGGRGGSVYVVTNLDDSGPGSFREACEAAGPRIVVFNVAGIIRLNARIRIRAPYITIAGNTAPGDGVCIAGDTVELETHDVVIRHMRFRRGGTDAADRNDSLGGNPIGNIMIDHVSASWGLDENMSMYRHLYRPPGGGAELKLPTVNITIQNSIFSEALNTYDHSFGSTIGGLNSTFMRNLWACNAGRNPSVGMHGDFTFANNVLYNYRHRTIDGGDHRSLLNIVNNYLKPGPGTPASPVAYRLLKPEPERSRTPNDNFGRAYVAGNFVEGHERVTRDNWDGGVQPEARGSGAAVLQKLRADQPFAHAPLHILSATDAYAYVLANAGATRPRRDAVDERVVQMVRTGAVGKAEMSPATRQKGANVGYAARFTAQQAALVRQGFITDPAEVGGYPEYRGTPYADADHDGMPDEWEQQHGLDTNDSADAAADQNGDGYTNIEDFINGLDPRAPKVDWTDLRNNVDRQNAFAGDPVLTAEALRRHVGRFNAMEDEPIVNWVPNAQAADWLERNIPRFECPDPEVEKIYFFRWWALRKHLRQVNGQTVFTEFINRATPVSSALGHHLMEGRWLRDQSHHDEYVLYWLHSRNGQPHENLHKYSQWLHDALYQRWLVTQDTKFLVSLLDDLVADYRQWEAEKQLPSGLFWQFDVRDAMEESISGSRTQRHVRPTINSYMFGNARALAAIARLAGRPEIATEFEQKAATLRRLTQEALWNPQHQFFEVRRDDGQLANVREAIGFIPWYFNLPEPGRGYEAAWAQFSDPKGFKAPFGITTAERRHPQFRSHGVGTCEWDGAVWPFATSQTLVALGNVLRDHPGAPVTNRDYFDAFRTYVRSHRYDGMPYIGEYLDETNGRWLKGPDPRSRWYNHSTFADLLITGVVGLRPRADDIVEVAPLLPAGTWDWFALDNVQYHGRMLTILWDRDGSRYRRGRGLSVWADGVCIGRSDTLERVTANLTSP